MKKYKGKVSGRENKTGADNLSQRIGQRIVFFRYKSNDTKEHSLMNTFNKSAL